MPCEIPRPFYIPKNIRGIRVINSIGDGYTMLVNWRRAYPQPQDLSIAYNIYYSTQQGEVSFEPPKFVSTNTSGLYANIIDFIPGDTYHFIVRATQYDPEWYNINHLPTDPSQTDGYLHIYPETLLSNDIDDETIIIPIEDINEFPSYGVIQVGNELIRYTSRDIPNNYLIASDRGFLGTEPRLHTTDGYDGYETLDSVIRFWRGYEEDNLFIIQEQNKFGNNFDIFTITDGYRVKNNEGILTTDLSANDDERVEFPRYDFSGWHRTDPKLFFNGLCMDTYIGGEHFCADGYNGINRQIRNISFADQADRHQEFLLEQLGTGERVVLLKRLYRGVTCRCFVPNQEHPDPKCGVCLGVGFVGGYEQYHYPRDSSGRILVRFDPSKENIQIEDAGLESHIIYSNCWTLSSPTIDDRDVIIRFLPNGVEEEFRYEVLDVTRNKLLFGATGNQHFSLQRIRKTAPPYQFRAIRDTSFIPTNITTTVGLVRGPLSNTPIPHTHVIVINEGITMLSQVNHTTKISTVGPPHSHPIVNGEVLEVLGHSHSIII